MLSYELCKKLKEAEFPQINKLVYCQNETWEEEKQNYVGVNWELGHHTCWGIGEIRENWCSIPTLSELIEACGNIDISISRGFMTDAMREIYRLYPQKYCEDKKIKLDKWIVEYFIECEVDKNSLEVCEISGDSPEEAVAKLWLYLNKK